MTSLSRPCSTFRTSVLRHPGLSRNVNGECYSSCNPLTKSKTHVQDFIDFRKVHIVSSTFIPKHHGSMLYSCFNPAPPSSSNRKQPQDRQGHGGMHKAALGICLYCPNTYTWNAPVMHREKIHMWWSRQSARQSQCIGVLWALYTRTLRDARHSLYRTQNPRARDVKFSVSFCTVWTQFFSRLGLPGCLNFNFR